LRESAAAQSRLARASIRWRMRWVISGGGPDGLVGSLTREG